MFLFLFTGDVVSKRGFSVSKTKPNPLGYLLLNKNPILEILADHANQDVDFPQNDLNGQKLIAAIIDALIENRIQWPSKWWFMVNTSSLGFITQSQWISCMKKDVTYYMYQTSHAQQFRSHEKILLTLASRFLERRIGLISFFPEDKDEIFKPSMLSRAKKYHMLSCNKVHSRNFYSSIVPNHSEV